MKDVPYLDKFAVSLQNQGLGAGETIWEKLKQDFPSLFWRSKGSNRINPWLVHTLVQFNCRRLLNEFRRALLACRCLEHKADIMSHLTQDCVHGSMVEYSP